MNHAVLVGLGFLAGSAGLKAVTSKPARKVYVKGLVQGMKAKDYCESIVESAKAEFDDIMAEAEYEKDSKDEPEAEVEAEEAAEEAPKPKRTRSTKAAKATEAE